MTPDQRMKLFSLIAKHEDCSDAQSALKSLYKITEFVEQLEFLAHNAGQDHQIELHKEHLQFMSTTCTWRG